MNEKKYLEKKSGLVNEILALSQKQAGIIREGEWDKLSVCTDAKGTLLDELSVLNHDYAKAHNLTDQEAPVTDEIKVAIEKTIETDKENIEKLQLTMNAVSGEIKGNKEKIKINKAYSPILGKEKNNSNRLDVKDSNK